MHSHHEFSADPWKAFFNEVNWQEISRQLSSPIKLNWREISRQIEFISEMYIELLAELYSGIYGIFYRVFYGRIDYRICRIVVKLLPPNIFRTSDEKVEYAKNPPCYRLQKQLALLNLADIWADFWIWWT